MRFLLIVILIIINITHKPNKPNKITSIKFEDVAPRIETYVHTKIEANSTQTTISNEDESEIYAGRFDNIKTSKYNMCGLPTNRKWLTSKEWRGSHIKSKEILNNFNEWKSAHIKKFIADASTIALVETKTYKQIPPSLIVAQMIIESNFGLSRLAIQANNYFGHKYYGNKNDATKFVIAADDDPDDKFTKFESRWFSIRNHSKLLMKKYHKRLKGKPNIKNWYTALCGGTVEKHSKVFVDKGNYVYATSCYKGGLCYAEKLNNIIIKYKLYKLDEQIK